MPSAPTPHFDGWMDGRPPSGPRFNRDAFVAYGRALRPHPRKRSILSRRSLFLTLNRGSEFRREKCNGWRRIGIHVVPPAGQEDGATDARFADFGHRRNNILLPAAKVRRRFFTSFEPLPIVWGGGADALINGLKWSCSTMVGLHLVQRTACPIGIAKLGGPALGARTPTYVEVSSMPFLLSKTSAAAMILIGSVGLGGCATKGFVRSEIATVNARIDGIDGRLRTVEGTSAQALAQAQAASGQAQQNGQRIDQLNGRVDGLDQQVQQQQKRQRKPRG